MTVWIEPDVVVCVINPGVVEGTGKTLRIVPGLPPEGCIVMTVWMEPEVVVCVTNPGVVVKVGNTLKIVPGLPFEG